MEPKDKIAIYHRPDSPPSAKCVPHREGPDSGCGNYDTDIIGASYLYQPLGVLKGRIGLKCGSKALTPLGLSLSSKFIS